MKKLLPVVVLVVCAGILIFVFSSAKKSKNSPVALAPSNIAPVHTPAAPITPAATKKVAAVALPKFTPPAFLDMDILKTARAAGETGNQEALDLAYTALIDYLKQHPEQVDDYVAALYTEKNEHVLRTLARAMAEAEVGLLENDKIIQAAIQLSKDSSFEQRQHIMLHLMSEFPQMNEDAYKAVVERSQDDPNSQVKTSAVAVLADWMDRYPDKTGQFLDQIGQIFKTSTDEDVRAFTYQVLALHKESLSPDLQASLWEQMKVEKDEFNRNILAATLSVASDPLRQEALHYVQALFNKETNEENRRNQLAQIVILGKAEAIPLLNQVSHGNSLLAQDARDYLPLITGNEPVEPEVILQRKAVRDTNLAEAMPAAKPGYTPHP